MPEGNDMSKLLLRSIFLIFLAMGLAACGGPGGGTAGAGGDTGGDDEEELPTISMGSFDSDTDNFVNSLEVSVNDGYISSGGTTGITAFFVYSDDLGVEEGVITAVTFNSDCITRGDAEVTATEFINNRAKVEYTDISCNESDDVTATVTGATNANAIGLDARATIYITPQEAGSITFVPPEEAIILDIQGAGNETSTELSFLVVDEDGDPLNDELVNFTVSDEQSGIYISPLSSTSGADDAPPGIVKTTIFSGLLPTTVNVYATIDSNPLKSTQSNDVAVTAGLPSQKGFGIVLDRYNPEVATETGVTVDITAYVSDRQAAALDGTVITFIAEAGQLDPATCTIQATESTRGECTTKWKSTTDHATDQRVTILAYTKGQEKFSDVDGDGLFNIEAEFNIADDLPEAFLDENENGLREDTEFYAENGNDPGVYNSTGDGVYNGYNCNHTSCESAQKYINVRDSVVLVESPSNATIEVTDISPTTTVVDGNTCILLNAANTMSTIEFTVIGDNGQSMPGGTTVGVETVSQGTATLIGPRQPWNVRNTSEVPVTYTATVEYEDDPGAGTFIIKVTSGETGTVTEETVCIVEQ